MNRSAAADDVDHVSSLQGDVRAWLDRVGAPLDRDDQAAEAIDQVEIGECLADRSAAGDTHLAGRRESLEEIVSKSTFWDKPTLSAIASTSAVMQLIAENIS